MDHGERVYASYNTAPKAPSTIHSVPMHEATLFSDAELVDNIVNGFKLTDAKLEHLEVTSKGFIKGGPDKYYVFGKMMEEQAAYAEEIKAPRDRKKEDANYPLYLFSMLWNEKHPEFNETEYDVTYENIIADWDKFQDSSYNCEKKSLYECISDFLSDTESKDIFGTRKETLDNVKQACKEKLYSDAEAGAMPKNIFIQKEDSMTEIEFTEDEMENYGISVSFIAEELSEAISNKTEFSHQGFTFMILVEADLDKSV